MRHGAYAVFRTPFEEQARSAPRPDHLNPAGCNAHPLFVQNLRTRSNPQLLTYRLSSSRAAGHIRQQLVGRQDDRSLLHSVSCEPVLNLLGTFSSLRLFGRPLMRASPAGIYCIAILRRRRPEKTKDVSCQTEPSFCCCIF